MKEMIYHDFSPAVIKFMDSLSKSILDKKQISSLISTSAEEKMLEKISSQYEALYVAVQKLDEDIKAAESMDDGLELAQFYHDPVFKDMEKVRSIADGIEAFVPDEFLPYPTYSKILFYV